MHKYHNMFFMVSEIIIDNFIPITIIVEIKDQVNIFRHLKVFQDLDDPDSFYDFFKACIIVEIRISEYSL